MTNEERATRAAMALLSYPPSVPFDVTETVINLVTDLLHLAELNGISPDHVVETAQDRFDAEDVAERGFYLGDENRVLDRMVDEQSERERKP